jgi:hypothetical protein
MSSASRRSIGSRLSRGRSTRTSFATSTCGGASDESSKRTTSACGAAASGWLKGLVAPDAVENGGGSTDGELLERLSFGAGSSTRG